MLFQPKFWLVNAFTKTPFLGNPAAVVYLEDQTLSDSQMQNIANEFNVSQTAFLTRNHKNQFFITWFSPNGGETPICVHATLASAWVLFFELHFCKKQLKIHSKQFDFYFEQEENHLKLTLNQMPIESETVYNFLPNDIECYKDQWIHIACFSNYREVENFIPDFEAIKKLPGRALCISAPGFDNFDFVSRYFAPKVGINEDPVCGSSYCRLAPLWGKKLNKTILYPKPLSKRSGELKIELKTQEINFFSNAVIISRGKILVNLF